MHKGHAPFVPSLVFFVFELQGRRRAFLIQAGKSRATFAKVVRTVLVDGDLYRRNADETLSPLHDETDYARLDALSVTEIERIAQSDAEGAPMSDEEWARAQIRQPVKKPVGLKLDDDILTWLKSQGRGYQTRINAVLRRYVEAQRKAG